MYSKLTEKTLPSSRARYQHHFFALSILFVALNCGAQTIVWFNPNTNYSIVRNWNERALEGIRMDTPHPPVQARNLFSFSVCMYDAWAAYDTNSTGFIYRGNIPLRISQQPGVKR
jgi:hypothetical protein